MAWKPHTPHVALDGALADPQAELEYLSAAALGVPQAVLSCHLLNQGDRLWGDLGPRASAAERARQKSR